MVVIFTVVMAKVGIPQMKEQKNSANIVRLSTPVQRVERLFIVIIAVKVHLHTCRNPQQRRLIMVAYSPCA